jgi:predicted NAD/FAD-dependent oxidoreductase
VVGIYGELMSGWSRRDVIKTSLLATGSLLAGGLGVSRLFKPEHADFPVTLRGPTSAAGHKLRDGFRFPPPGEVKNTHVLIVGGGVAGLSAAWRLQKKDMTDFKLVELESEVGGNSRAGANAVSKFPWGAHYVTLLNDEAHFAKELYRDLGIITGEKNGRPTYNEYYFCRAPHERLFVDRKWQDGLLPKMATAGDPAEALDAKAFFDLVEEYRFAKGSDGRPAFTIPLGLSSRDPKFLALDQITIAEFMRQRGWNSPSLHWYVNYCCRDDYGTPHSQTSAWAGLHYFCARRGQADGVEGSAVLTWPEGNGWIVNQLKEKLRDFIVPDSMAMNIQEGDGHVMVDVWNERTQAVTRWQAKALILAIPRFVVPHLGVRLAESQRPLAKAVSYAPWLVVNITLRQAPPVSTGAPLAWDNVFYHGDSLGYVVATHQRNAIHTDATVWTYYRPLDHDTPENARKEAMATTAAQWRSMVLADLSVAHPGIEGLITSMDVWVWGHAMPRATPGFIWGEARAQMQKSVGRIHFAHSDMSGISIFEEANDHGVRAADEVLKNGFS